MCKTINDVYIADDPGKRTLDGAGLKAAFKNKDELCFETLGSDDIYGTIEKLEDNFIAWVLEISVTKIGDAKVRSEKKWEAHYDPSRGHGTFFDKE